MIRESHVDLTTLARGVTGVSVYARNLAAHLETSFDCRILAPIYLASEFRRGAICPAPIYLKRSLVGRRPPWNRRAGISFGNDSFVYAPHMRGSWSRVQPVITIHDLIAQYHPTRGVLEKASSAQLPPRIARTALGVVTVSEASRRDIAQYFRIKEAKIAVVGNGLDLSRWTPATQPRPEGEPPYLLAVSANRPCKSTLELIEHHRLWSDRYRLKIVSTKAQYGTAIRAAVVEAGLTGRVDFLDDLLKKALIDLYRYCAAVVFPSSMEAFGRPALEAMAVERPIILSDIPVHREIFGSAAILITPGDLPSWEAAFKRLDDEPNLASLITAARPIVQRFCWHRVAGELETSLLRYEPGLDTLRRRH